MIIRPWIEFDDASIPVTSESLHAFEDWDLVLHGILLAQYFERWPRAPFGLGEDAVFEVEAEYMGTHGKLELYFSNQDKAWIFPSGRSSIEPITISLYDVWELVNSPRGIEMSVGTFLTYDSTSMTLYIQGFQLSQPIALKYTEAKGKVYWDEELISGGKGSRMFVAQDDYLKNVKAYIDTLERVKENEAEIRHLEAALRERNKRLEREKRELERGSSRSQQQQDRDEFER